MNTFIKHVVKSDKDIVHFIIHETILNFLRYSNLIRQKGHFYYEHK